MKCRALQLLDNGWELEEITEVLGISKESVDQWLDNYATHGQVDPHLDCPRSGPGPVRALFADPGPGPQVQVQSFSDLDLDTSTAVY